MGAARRSRPHLQEGPPVTELFTNPAFTAMLAAGVAGLAGYFAKRAEKAPEMQASLDKAVAAVVDHYKAALDRDGAEIREMRDEIRALRETINDLHDTISELEDHVDALTNALEKAGVVPPPRRKRAAAS